MTVKEIAQKAGVSIGTVDRVLHKRGRVSDETRDRILAIIQESDYRPNPMARHLQRGRGYLFRVFMPRQDDESYWDLALEGVKRAQNELAAFGVTIQVVEFNRYQPDAARRAFMEMVAGDCDGIALAPVGTDRIRELIRQIPQSIPYVFFDAALDQSEPLSTITQDPFRSGFLAGRLMSLFCPGAQDLAVINSHPEDQHLNRRVEGFNAYFMKNPNHDGSNAIPGLLPRVKEYRADKGPQGPELARLCQELRSRPELPEGIYICNANAAGFLRELGDVGPQGQRPSILGHDLVAANKALLLHGRLDGLISQSPEHQSFQALQMLYRKVVLHEAVPPVLEAPLEIILPENLARED